jgi:aminopeptidase N
MTLVVRDDLIALANGAQTAESKIAGGQKSVTWELKERCPSYLICFAVGEFTEADGGDVDGIPLRYYSCKDFTADDLKLSFAPTGEMLRWMQGRLGVKYPYPKYYQFALPGLGGAMENISLVSWSDQFLTDSLHTHEGQWLIDQINLHEMAHSYFGDLVVCRDFAHAWLKESWATYMESCWLEHKKGKDEQLYDLYCNAQAYFSEADQSYIRPILTRHFTSSWQMYDRHLYQGGACRLHTLRMELGDELFWAGVQSYLEAYAGEVVETSDFRRIMERVSGRSLQRWFDQWIELAAYPKIKVTFSYDSTTKKGLFNINQLQVDGGKKLIPFDLTTALGWTIDGKHFTRQIKLSEAKHSFEIDLEKEPEQVHFDPNWQCLHKLEFEPSTAQLAAQLVAGPTVTMRIHAAEVLCKTGKAKDIQAVVSAYKQEPFWGVRREMARALADSQCRAAEVGLAELILWEKDPMVLHKLLSASQRLVSPVVGKALEERLAQGGLGHWAKAALLTSLAIQGHDDIENVLFREAQTSEPKYGTVQSAALSAIGRLRDEQHGPWLLDKAGKGMVPYRARFGVVQGLGSLAPYAGRKTAAALAECLVGLLRDEDRGIAMAAARALGRISAPGVISALEAYRTRLPLQEQVAIDAIIADSGKAGDTVQRDLAKQVEDLQSKIRSFGDKLQNLEQKFEQLRN